MNSVPFAFYDAVTQSVQSKTVPTLLDLSGLAGAVASQTHQNLACEALAIANGQLVTTICVSVYNRNTIGLISPTYRLCTSFNFYGTDEDQEADADTISAIMAHRNTPEIHLYLHTSRISKELEECVSSLRFVSGLCFTGRADLIPRFMSKFVPRRTLISVDFSLVQVENVFDETTTALLLDLLKQEQFGSVSLPEKSNVTLKKIIAEWKRDSKKFSGKNIKSRLKPNDPVYQKAVEKGNIRECTESETRFLDLYYPQFEAKNPLISKNRKGGAIYWHRDEKQVIRRNK